MGWFSKLFGLGPKDPTESFPKPLVPPKLVWDTGSRTLNRIPLLGPVESLAPFGPCEEFRPLGKRYVHLSYLSLGIEFGVVDGRIDEFTIFLHDDPDEPRPGFRPAKLLVEPAGTLIGPGTTEEQLTALFGPGDKKVWDDGEEIEIGYRHGDVCFDATFTGEGRLVDIEVYDEKE